MALVKSSFIYLGTELINKAIPFLLLPLLTKYLTPTEYGIYGMYQVIISFLAPFISMSLDINITKNFFKVNKEEMSKILSSIFLILHINIIISLIIIYIISLFYSNFLGIPSNILLIMPIIIFAQTINGFNLTILRNLEKPLIYGTFQTILTVINFSLAIFLLIFFHLSWMSLVYGVLIAHISVAIYSFIFLKKEYKLEFNFYPLKKIYQISLPLIFHLLGGSVIFLFDRIFIQQMLGLQDVGYYSIANQFGMITMIFINAIIMAINPWMFKKLSNNDKDIVKKSYYFMGIFLISGLFILGISLLIFPYVINHTYFQATNVIPWITFAFIVRGFYQIFYNVIVYEGKTNFFMYITFSAAIINLILNYFLIKLNGMIGAAQATFVVFTIMFVFAFYYANKISSIKWIKV
jgi:O-antigen/teichoic acid export membrane protein